MANHTITVNADFVIAALEERVRVCESRGWWSEAAESLWSQVVELVEQCGLGENTTSPSEFVDNYCFNGDFISKEDWVEQNREDCDEQEANEKWQKYCEDECLLHNEDFACRQF